MKNSIFWRFTAMLAIAAAFYIGHGLHNGMPIPSPIDSPLHAGGIAMSENVNSIITTNEAGTVLHMWRHAGIGKAEYVGKVTMEPTEK